MTLNKKTKQNHLQRGRLYLLHPDVFKLTPSGIVFREHKAPIFFIEEKNWDKENNSYTKVVQFLSSNSANMWKEIEGHRKPFLYLGEGGYYQFFYHQTEQWDI